MASRTALRQYHQKRDFTRTKEPRGQLARKTGDLFVVQKHAARRLHYDLRLELDGVLKSWAVTKGPSLSPADKRLAVRVEDHPLDYAEFEGRIPEGEYGAGSVIVWDRGRWSTEGDPHKQLAKGHLIVDLDGGKLKGRWHLVHMRGRDQRGKENWLLIKAEDAYATDKAGTDLLDAEPRSIKTGRTIEDVAASEVKIRRKPAARSNEQKSRAPRKSAAGIKGAKSAQLPSFVEPQLASLAYKPPTGESWVHEIKFDGYRLVARIDRGHAKLKTRSGLDWTTKFVSLKKALEALPVVGDAQAERPLAEPEVQVDLLRVRVAHRIHQGFLRDAHDLGLDLRLAGSRLPRDLYVESHAARRDTPANASKGSDDIALVHGPRSQLPDGFARLLNVVLELAAHPDHGDADP